MTIKELKELLDKFPNDYTVSMQTDSGDFTVKSVWSEPKYKEVLLLDHTGADEDDHYTPQKENYGKY